MLGWFLVGVSVLIMAKVADQENKSPVLWGAITFGVCLASVRVIRFPFLSILIGLVASFLAMTVVNVLAKPRK